MATDLCLRCLKFSNALGVRSDNTLTWNHISASDMFVVVKGIHTKADDGTLTMRILRGNQVLESIDIGSHVDDAIHTQRTFDQAGIRHQIDDLPIFAIAKESLLALRYRRSDGQTQRVQVRMQDSRECRQLVNAFERRGMLFLDQRPRTARSGMGTTIINKVGNQATNTQANPSYFDSIETLPGVSPLAQSSGLPPGPLLQYQAGTSEASTTGAVQSVTSSCDMPPSRLLIRNETTAPRDAMPRRPTISQMFRSHTTLSQPSMLNSNRPSDDGVHVYADRSSVPSRAGHEGAIMGAAVRQPYYDRAPSKSASLTMSAEPQQVRVTSPAPSVMAISSESLEDNAPSSRELPYGRARNQYASCDRPQPRPSSSALDLPPLPKPNLVNDAAGSLGSRSGSSNFMAHSSPGSKAALPFKRPLDLDQQAASSVHSTTRIDEHRPGTRERFKPKLGRMDELLYGRNPLVERSANATIRLSTTADAPDKGSLPQASSPPTSCTPRDQVVVDSSGGGICSSRPFQLPLLEAYTSQSLTDRQTALDDFMLANLENAEFATLCEDVENCWRRIVLGL